MTTQQFDWFGRSKYLSSGHLPPSTPLNVLNLFSPRDGAGIHQLIVDLLKSAQRSIVGNHFGYDDEEADNIIREKMLDEHVYVQLSLDSTQAAGAHEKALLAKWPTGALGTSLAIGQSSKHAISHLKVTIVDAFYVICGSTNWSLSGEEKQDNQLTLFGDAGVAADFRTILDINHDFMLKAMGKGARP